MRDDYGYFEEDQLGKFGDLSLWRRIVFLGRPYWLGALLAVLLSIVVVGCGLALPYLIWGLAGVFAWFQVRDEIKQMTHRKGDPSHD